MVFRLWWAGEKRTGPTCLVPRGSNRSSLPFALILDDLSKKKKRFEEWRDERVMKRGADYDAFKEALGKQS